ncbi:MAG: hypothetical protein U0610_27340 [bacterium]
MRARQLSRTLLWGACVGAAMLVAPRRAAAAACVPINGGSAASNWYCDPFQTPSDVEVDGDEPLVPSYPDAANRYAVLAYKFTDKSKVLRLHGAFRDARFENLNVELFKTASTGLYTRVANIAVNDHDTQNENRRGCKPSIDANCGPDLVAASGCNPATSSNPQACIGSPYEVALVDAASAAAWKSLHPGETINVIPLAAPPATVTVVRVAWRLANGGTAKAPTVSWESTSGVVVSGPVAPDLQNDFTEEDVTLGATPCGSKGCVTETYHIDPGPGQLHNFATEYLGSTLAMLNASTDVVVYKFRSPDSAIGYPSASLAGTEDVRYWSACLGYATTTTITSPDLGCTRDQDGTTPADGYERVVIGPDVNVSCPGHGTIRLAACAQSRQHHYVTWGALGTATNRVFIYRNVQTSPAFPGSAITIPACVSWPSSCPSAAGYIGSWAPRGKHCTLDTYLSSPASCEAW